MNSQKKKTIEEQLEVGRFSGGRKLWKLLVFLCLMLIGFFVIYIFYPGKTSGNVQYRTKPAQKGNLTITVTATGTLEPINQVDVGVEVSGTVKSVQVDYNDRVKTGQVLARLDTSKLTAQVLQAKAALESAKAGVTKADADVKQTALKLAQLQNVSRKSGGKLPSKVEMDGAEAAIAKAKADKASALADVAKAEAALQFNETDLSKAIIHSPIDGIVLLRRVEPGQTVAASLQTPVLFTIAQDLTRMELHVDVDEADVGRVKTGQHATFTVDAYPLRHFKAEVTQVRYSPKTVEGVVTYETVLFVDNSDLSLMPGMTATADIVVNNIKNAVLIPNAALRFTLPVQKEKEKGENRGLLGALLPHRPRRSKKDDLKKNLLQNGQRRVWTLQKGTPVLILVRTGETDGRLTEVLGGNIKPGMELITDALVSEK